MGPGVSTGAVLREKLWIVAFIAMGFLFSVLAPWYLALPLVLASSVLGALDAYAHRGQLGTQWVAATIIFGVLWLVFAMGGAFRHGGRLFAAS